MTSSPRTTRSAAIWTLAGLVLLTLNLRAAITGVPPLLGELQDTFGLTGVEVSVLTTLPELCLGVFSALAPLLARRIGTEAAITAALVVITAGLLLRVVPAQTALFSGTVLAAAGMATALRSELRKIGTDILRELRNGAPDPTAHWTAP
ncbi:hypothetical protein [Streptomyces eurythermus]|uniref:hypothetical protein n=1 Tax=Streptomyces eurythermus TaxID=42237 RepID=UPI0033EEF8C6